jgi:hypothetical protein
MTSTLLECPHCGAEKVGFSIVYERPMTRAKNTSIEQFQTFMVCSNCEGGIIGHFERPVMQPAQTPAQCQIDPRALGFKLSATFPKPEPLKLPTHIPADELKSYFNQAWDSLRRGNWDASGAMSRKVVDVSTQMLLGTDATKYKSIKDRIDGLGARHQLTPDLKEWAHEVRLGGNDASHDKDPFTQAEAEELLDFTELYLTYVYSLPGRLAERKAQALKAKSASTATP